MPIIDMHAHLTPECFRRGVQSGGLRNGMTSSVSELGNPRDSWIVAQRMQETDSLGIDVQVAENCVSSGEHLALVIVVNLQRAQYGVLTNSHKAPRTGLALENGHNRPLSSSKRPRARLRRSTSLAPSASLSARTRR